MEGYEISNLCYKLGIRGIYEQRVVDFVKAQGDKGYDICLEILQGIQKHIDFQKKEGLRPDSPNTLFAQATERYVHTKKNRERIEQEDGEWQQKKDMVSADRARGYVPTQDVVKKQLDDLLSQKKIKQHEYDWGMIGLSCVHSMVAAGQQAYANQKPAVVGAYDD